MPDYLIYGECLRSEIEFPELRPCQGLTASWHFRPGPRVELIEPEMVGEEHLYQDIHVRLYRHRHGWRVDVGDCGTFDLSSDGRNVSWCPYEDGWLDFARAHLMGRVLATSMHFAGRIVLHGSAVAIDGGAIAFLAPKHFGKSTLALALTQAGAGLLTDDTLPVDLGSCPIAWPGVHSLRLNPDSVDRLGLPASDVLTRDGKHVLRDLPDSSLATTPVPLQAVYFLVPVEESPTTPAVARERLETVMAAPGLVGHTKIGAMLGRDAAVDLLQRACALANTVPVYTLRVQRTFDALESVVDIIQGWHSDPVGATGTREAQR